MNVCYEIDFGVGAIHYRGGRTTMEHNPQQAKRDGEGCQEFTEAIHYER
jgi:hypothetical protein